MCVKRGRATQMVKSEIMLFVLVSSIRSTLGGARFTSRSAALAWQATRVYIQLHNR